MPQLPSILLAGGEVDVRGCYCALAACEMLCLDKAAVAAACGMTDFIRRCQVCLWRVRKGVCCEMGAALKHAARWEEGMRCVCGRMGFYRVGRG